jgi:tetratricopeptide (TPR) repeat protein
MAQVVRIDPDNPKVLYRHASALVGVGQLQEARQSLIKADAVKPGDASIEGLLREVDAKLGLLAEEAHLTAKKPTRVGDAGASAISGGDAPLGDKVDAPTGEENDLRSGAVRDAGGGDGVTQTCVSLASKMKKDGNDLFKKGMYAAAMEEYRDAIEMLTRPGVDKVMVKELLAQCRNNAAASAVRSR